MKIEELSLDVIKPYEKNPRKNEGAVDGVAESIKQFGFQQPIVVDKNNVIVAGHTRYKAAQKLGLKTVPCVRADQLTKEQIKAYRILDNKLNELATWNFEALAEELKSFKFDFSGFNFDFSDFQFSLDDEKKSTESESNSSSKLSEEKASLEITPETVFKYGIYVEVDTEEEQQELYNRFVEEGYNVRLTTL